MGTVPFQVLYYYYVIADAVSCSVYILAAGLHSLQDTALVDSGSEYN